MAVNEDILCEKRFVDLARQADQKGIVCFSNFLTIHELNILREATPRLYGTHEVFGGYPNAERQMAAFLPDAFCYEWNYPINCIQLQPMYPKFAQELSHRDVLGALMSLGLERDKLGDILAKQNTFYLFVRQEMSSYILEELHEIRHTVVQCQIVPPQTAENLTPNMTEHTSIIASNRLDNVIAAFSGRSRSHAVMFIQSGKIFINGAECLHNIYICKPGDIISVRGIGKFVFDSVSGETKKGRIKILYRQYI